MYHKSLHERIKRTKIYLRCNFSGKNEGTDDDTFTIGNIMISITVLYCIGMIKFMSERKRTRA